MMDTARATTALGLEGARSAAGRAILESCPGIHRLDDLVGPAVAQPRPEASERNFPPLPDDTGCRTSPRTTPWSGRECCDHPGDRSAHGTWVVRALEGHLDVAATSMRLAMAADARVVQHAISKGPPAVSVRPRTRPRPRVRKENLATSMPEARSSMRSTKGMEVMWMLATSSRLMTRCCAGATSRASTRGWVIHAAACGNLKEFARCDSSTSTPPPHRARSSSARRFRRRRMAGASRAVNPRRGAGRGRGCLRATSARDRGVRCGMGGALEGGAVQGNGRSNGAG